MKSITPCHTKWRSTEDMETFRRKGCFIVLSLYISLFLSLLFSFLSPPKLFPVLFCLS